MLNGIHFRKHHRLNFLLSVHKHNKTEIVCFLRFVRDRIDKHALYVNMYVTLRRGRREITFFWVIFPFKRTFCSTTLILSVFRSSPIINSFAYEDHKYATPSMQIVEAVNILKKDVALYAAFDLLYAQLVRPKA